MKNNPDVERAFNELIAITNENAGIELKMGGYDETYFIRKLIHYFIKNLTDNSYYTIQENNINSLDDVQDFAKKGGVLIRFSEKDKYFFSKFKDIIYKNIYGSQTVKTMDKKAVEVVDKLYNEYDNDPTLLPPEWLYKLDHRNPNEDKAITICDFISGMTDRSILDEFERLFNPRIKI